MDRATSYGKTIDNRFARRDERAHEKNRASVTEICVLLAQIEKVYGDSAKRIPFVWYRAKADLCFREKRSRKRSYLIWIERRATAKRLIIVLPGEMSERIERRASVTETCVLLAQIEKVYGTKGWGFELLVVHPKSIIRIIYLLQASGSDLLFLWMKRKINLLEYHEYA